MHPGLGLAGFKISNPWEYRLGGGLPIFAICNNFKDHVVKMGPVRSGRKS
jgi:hypothetical protein